MLIQRKSLKSKNVLQYILNRLFSWFDCRSSEMKISQLGLARCSLQNLLRLGVAVRQGRVHVGCNQAFKCQHVNQPGFRNIPVCPECPPLRLQDGKCLFMSFPLVDILHNTTVNTVDPFQGVRTSRLRSSKFFLINPQNISATLKSEFCR